MQLIKTIKEKKASPYILAAVAYTVLIVVVYFPIVFGGKSLYPLTYAGRSTDYLLTTPSYENNITHRGTYLDAGAADWIEVPFFRSATAAVKQGELPLWDPYNALGMPIIQNTNGSTLAPLSFFLYFVNTEGAWNCMYMLRLFFILYCSWLFLREMGFSDRISFFGGCLFGFCGYITYYLNIFFLHVDAFIPLLMWVTMRFVKHKSPGNWFLVAVAIAGMSLGGNPQNLITNCFLSISFYLVATFLVDKKQGSYLAGNESAIEIGQRSVGWLDYGKSFSVYIGAYVFGCLITLFYWLSFIELYLRGFNYHTSSGLAKVTLSTMQGLLYPQWTLDATLFPSHIPYLGITAIAAIVLQLRLRKNRPDFRYKIFSLIYISLFLLKIVGFPLVHWIGHLPIFSQIGYTKYNASIYFAAAILFCFALKDMEEREPGKSAWIRSGSSMVLGLGALGFLAYKYLEYLLKVAPEVLRPDVILPVLIVLMLMAGLCVSAMMGRKRATVLALCGLMCVELISVPVFMHHRRVDSGYALADPPFVEKLKELRENEYDRIFAIDTLLMGNLSSTFRIQDIRGVSATPELQYFTFMRDLVLAANMTQIVTTTSPGYNHAAKPILDLLGVRYIMIDNGGEIKDHGLEEVYASDRLTIYQNENAFDRAFLVHDVVYLEETTDIFDFLRNPQTDLSKTVTLTGLEESLPLESPQEQEWVHIEKYTANHVRMDCEISANGVLVLSDLDYTGWQVLVDGKKRDILQTDYILRGVYLEKGVHQVEFVYRPLSVYLGLAVSGGFLALFVIWWLLYRRKNIR